jgi:hypothetical protein
VERTIRIAAIGIKVAPKMGDTPNAGPSWSGPAADEGGLVSTPGGCRAGQAGLPPPGHDRVGRGPRCLCPQSVRAVPVNTWGGSRGQRVVVAVPLVFADARDV